MLNKKYISVVILLTLVLSACTFDSSQKNDNNVDISDSEISTEGSSLEESITQKVEEKTEEDKPNIIIPDTDYSSLPTQEIEFDSIKLFKEPIKFESNDIFIHNEIGIITDGKYKNYIFGTARFGGQFGDHKTDFHLREPGKSNLLYLAESTKYKEEEGNRQTISDFNVPSLEFEEESILYKGNDLVTDGTLYYNKYLLSKIRNYEEVQSEDTSYTLYKKGWAFYRIIQDNFYLLYQYRPIDKELSNMLRSMSNLEQDNYYRYLLMEKYEGESMSTISEGYMNLFDDQGIIQGQANILNFDNLEQIYDGSELDLYTVKEFHKGDDYISQLLEDIWVQYEVNLEYITEYLANGEENIRNITNVSKDEFLAIKPVIIRTDNMGEFSVYIRSDIIEPFEA